MTYFRKIPIANLGATGTPSATTYLRGDDAWATPAGGVSDGDYGDVTVGGSGTTMTVDAIALLDGSKHSDTVSSPPAVGAVITGQDSASPTWAATSVPSEAGMVLTSTTGDYGNPSVWRQPYAYEAMSSNTELTSGHCLVEVTAGAAIQLPNVTSMPYGKLFIIKNYSSTTDCTVLATTYSGYIDANTTATLAPYGYILLMRGTVWLIVGQSGVTLSGTGYD